MLALFPSKNLKNKSVATAMHGFFKFFTRKNSGAFWSNLFNSFHLFIFPSQEKIIGV